MDRAQQIRLVRAALAGDRAAEHRLVEEFSRIARVVILTRPVVQDHEDFCQEVIQDAWRRWTAKPYNESRGCAPITYFLLLVRSAKHDELRRRLRHERDRKRLRSLAFSTATESMLGYTTEELSSAIRKLDTETYEQTVILASFGLRLTKHGVEWSNGYTDIEIAEMLNISRHQARRIRVRALSKLRMFLAESVGGEHNG